MDSLLTYEERGIDIYGTIGPACSDPGTLTAMFREGMTGIRLNTSHVSLKDAAESVRRIHAAAAACGIHPKLLIDLQGPELRVGHMEQEMMLRVGAAILPGVDFPIPEIVKGHLTPGTEILLDDGKLLIKMIDTEKAVVLRGGVLKSGKSLALRRDTSESRKNPALHDDISQSRMNPALHDDISQNGKNPALHDDISQNGKNPALHDDISQNRKNFASTDLDLHPPTMTEQDLANIADAIHYGVTGVMQPFVRDAEDLRIVRRALDEAGGREIRLLAKIENLSGVKNLESFFGIADEIVIARGDLGNAMPLWELPRVQKEISEKCRKAGVPFMVVTQMLASMEHCAVPTRAEVSDIYNAVCDGCSSVMVTGETAVGEYPVEVIRYLTRTVRSCHTSPYSNNM